MRDSHSASLQSDGPLKRRLRLRHTRAISALDRKRLIPSLVQTLDENTMLVSLLDL